MKAEKCTLVNNISVIPSEVMGLFMFMLGKFVMALRMGNGVLAVYGKRIMIVVVVEKNEDVVKRFITVLDILMKGSMQFICLKR